MKYIALLLLAACLCLEWTRLAGTVKAINLRDATVTIQNRDGDLMTVPVDYQVKIQEKRGDLLTLKQLALDQKIVLTRTLQEKPAEDLTPEATQR